MSFAGQGRVQGDGQGEEVGERRFGGEGSQQLLEERRDLSGVAVRPGLPPDGGRSRLYRRGQLLDVVKQLADLGRRVGETVVDGVGDRPAFAQLWRK